MLPTVTTTKKRRLNIVEASLPSGYASTPYLRQNVTPLRTLLQHSHLVASAYIFIRLAISLRRPQVLGGGQCSRTALPVSSATNIDIHFTLASQLLLYIPDYELPNHSSGLSSNHCQTIIYLKTVKCFLYKNNYELFCFQTPSTIRDRRVYFRLLQLPVITFWTRFGYKTLFLHF